MNFLELAHERYSVRSFSDKPVEQDKLEKILEAGQIAPTARNTQPIKIFVFQSAEALEKARALTPCTYGAPLVLLICYDLDLACTPPTRSGYNFGEMDASIVTTHLMMEAQDLGLGSCWVGMFKPEEVIESLDLPQNLVPAAFLPIGYPSQDTVPSKAHEEYRPLSETVSYL